LLQEAAAEPSAVHNIRILILDGFLQSTADGIETNLAAAYRGNTGKAETGRAGKHRRDDF